MNNVGRTFWTSGITVFTISAKMFDQFAVIAQPLTLFVRALYHDFVQFSFQSTIVKDFRLCTAGRTGPRLFQTTPTHRTNGMTTHGLQWAKKNFATDGTMVFVHTRQAQTDIVIGDNNIVIIIELILDADLFRLDGQIGNKFTLNHSTNYRSI